MVCGVFLNKAGSSETNDQRGSGEGAASGLSRDFCSSREIDDRLGRGGRKGGRHEEGCRRVDMLVLVQVWQAPVDPGGREVCKSARDRAGAGEGGRAPAHVLAEQSATPCPCRACMDKGLGIEVVYIWVLPRWIRPKSRGRPAPFSPTPLRTWRLTPCRHHAFHPRSWLR